MPTTSRSILEAIGNTPLLQLRRVVPSGAARVFLKLEYFNPTGSYKDRMALSIIEGAEQRGSLRPGMRVVEYTGGSTGSSLAMVCAVKGYQFTPVSSDAFAPEKLATMRAFGGDLVLVPSDEGRITPPLFDRMKAELARQNQQPDTFWADQFNNEDAVLGYMNVGREILAQLQTPVDLFCAGVGTGAMVVGAGRALKMADPRTKIIGLEPAQSPTLTKGQGGAHHVEGIGVGFVPPFLKPGTYDQLFAISENEARIMARRLAQEEGALAGTSTGLNVAAAVKLAADLGSQATVVTVVCDSGLKYLHGDLFTKT